MYVIQFVIPKKVIFETQGSELHITPRDMDDEEAMGSWKTTLHEYLGIKDQYLFSDKCYRAEHGPWIEGSINIQSNLKNIQIYNNILYVSDPHDELIK